MTANVQFAKQHIVTVFQIPRYIVPNAGSVLIGVTIMSERHIELAKHAIGLDYKNRTHGTGRDFTSHIEIISERM